GGIICTAHHAREPRPGRYLLGAPLPNARVYVCDAAGRPLPVGVPGELLLGGPGVARGYGGRPELTAERFVPDALSGEPGRRLYRTGDRARWLDDGTLEFLGRADEQVKLRGYRIEPGEVEAALLDHGSVAEAAVVLRDDRLVGYYTSRGPAGAEELRAHLRARLPEYMVPSRLVALDALPLTPTGKVDRAALPAPARDGGEPEYVAPRGPVEEALAGVWREVLRLDRVGVHDDFFSLGGDSVLSIQAVARARKAGVELKPRDLFEHPTIAELAPLAAVTGSGSSAPALRTEGEEDAYPLSPMQEAMLFHTLLAPGGGGYVGQLVFTLEGDVDVPALRRAWQGAVDRHPALRTGFVWEGVEAPLQVVHRRADLPFREEDWRTLPDAERTERLEAFLREDRAAGFEPARAPLMRMALFRLRDDLCRMVWTHHHLVSDGWSIPLVFRDVVALFDAHSRGEGLDLGEAPPYRGYVDWLGERDPAAAERFWREALAGVAAPTPLEIPRPAGPPEDGPAPGRFRMELPKAETAALEAAARRHRLTVNTLFQGTWALLLSRYAGEEDVLFGAVVSGRPGELPGVEETVGLFINTVPVRARVEPRERLPEWLAALQRQLAAAREHAYTPLVQIRSWTGVPASQPLFESVLVFQNHPVEDVVAGGERGFTVRVEEATEQADLPLTLVAVPGARLRLEAEYRRDRFAPEAVERLLEQLRALLTGIAADPGRTLGELDLLSAAERRRMLEEWSGTPGEPASLPVHESFAARVRERPDAVAVVAGEERLTYAELDARSARLAGALRRRGVAPEDRVALHLERGAEMVVAMLAALRAGCAFVPLDPAYRSERLARMLADSGARVAVTQPGLEAGVAREGVEVVLAGEESGEGGTAEVSPDQLAYVVYTSGSTGAPKGVAVPHGALAAVVDACARLHGIGPETRLLQTYSFGFDPAVLDVFMALTTGAELHVAGREDQLAPERLAELLRTHAITAAALPPALLGAIPEDGLPDLRTVIAGGEACPPETVARWSRGRRFFVAYGPTETTVVATALEVDGPVRGAPLGRPVPGVRAGVVDAEGRPLPAGVPGELLVGGAGVARGYLGRPDLTAERFVPDELSGEAGARAYRTGDRARRGADGTLEFLGRMDQQVKVRGFRIEPGEVEAVLAAHPSVREAVVTAREDAPGERRLVGYVTGCGTGISTDDLRAHARERLPEHMVPSAFVVLEALPLTPGGKIDRRALPAPERGADPTAYVAPRTPVEEVLAEIVAEVLGLERVGVEDGFFDVGGHSLLATRVLARIRRAFGVDLPMRALFESPTVAGLAAWLAAEPAEVPVAGEVDGEVLDAVLDRLEELSDEEVMRLLAEGAL
ncbi:MAG TPA: amino acid adenylation domain-containing protein, partial [Longimicrobiaceae bacterium]